MWLLVASQQLGMSNTVRGAGLLNIEYRSRCTSSSVRLDPVVDARAIEPIPLVTMSPRSDAPALTFVLALLLVPGDVSASPETDGRARAKAADADREHCTRLYVLCKQQGWEGPCSDCLHKCNTQTEWDFNLCHPRKRR